MLGRQCLDIFFKAYPQVEPTGLLRENAYLVPLGADITAPPLFADKQPILLYSMHAGLALRRPVTYVPFISQFPCLPYSKDISISPPSTRAVYIYGVDLHTLSSMFGICGQSTVT